MQVFQTTPGWQLDARITPTDAGHHLLISRFVASAKRPEHQVKFSGTFSTDELQLLRDALNNALNNVPSPVA